MSFGTDEIGTDELWLIQGLVKMRYAGVEVAPPRLPLICAQDSHLQRDQEPVQQ